MPLSSLFRRLAKVLTMAGAAVILAACSQASSEAAPGNEVFPFALPQAA